jgi:CO/xanthine dehydrogenase Mo-binding subunit
MGARSSVVGVAVPRVDAPAKVTGAARYVDDLPASGALVGRTVRGEQAHGVVRAVHLDPGFDWDQVTVVTAADVPGRNCIMLDTDDQPALVAVGDRVRHAGEAVALVAAPTRDLAAAAAAAVSLDIDALPAVLSVEGALRGDVTVGGHGNVAVDLGFERGGVDAALAEADVVVEGTYRTGPAEHAYLETQGMLVWWDGGRIHAVGSLQCPWYVHRALTVLFDLPAGRVEVTQATTGGGFGGKEEYPSTVAAHAALLAHRSGRPVRMVYERGEDIAATTKRHPSVIHHRLGATSGGHLLVADVDIVLDGGAYVTLSPLVLMRAVVHAAGPYRLPNVRVRGRAVHTNHPPSGAFRGFGAPQAIFAMERQVAKMCRELGADPIALRRTNALRPGDVTATGGRADDGAALPQVLDALEEQLATTPPHRRPAEQGAVHRGRGIAVALHGAGLVGDGEANVAATATVDVAPDGTFRVLASTVDMGQGARTVLAQLAADALGVDLALVDVPEPSTDLVPDTGPTVASRTTLVAGGMVQRAAGRLREELLSWAREHDLGSDVHAAAKARAASGEHPTVTEGYTPPPGVGWDQEQLCGDAYPTYGWSAVAVDVAVDDVTSEVTVERCVQAVDVGRAVNPAAVVGQVHGGTAQGLGWALLEHVARPGGAIPAPSLSTTIIPAATDVPEIEAVVVEVPFPGGPSGAKGVGELPLDAPPAAAANAIEDALGVPTDELPVLPEVIHRLRGGSRCASPST